MQLLMAKQGRMMWRMTNDQLQWVWKKAVMTKYGFYSMINPKKSPAWEAGNVRGPRLISQVGRMGEVVCA